MRHVCDEVLDAYVTAATPASKLKIRHHWLEVTSSEAKEKWLKFLRPGDMESATVPAMFLEEHGPSFVYPLSLFGYYLGFAFRAIESKQMRTFVRYPKSACYTAFSGSMGGLPPGGVTVVIVEGFADAEAMSRIHPWVVATMGGKLRYSAYPVIAAVARKVILLNDNDAAGSDGRKAEKKGFQMMRRPVEEVTYPQRYKDPAEWWLSEPENARRVVQRLVS